MDGFIANTSATNTDDCPCLEDAIAFASVVLGAFLSHWAVHFSGAAEHARSVVMPGSG